MYNFHKRQPVQTCWMRQGMLSEIVNVSLCSHYACADPCMQEEGKSEEKGLMLNGLFNYIHQVFRQK